ncbi:tRNA (guanine-N(1)-)-methyltransferase [Planctomycetaceae bacterium]|nr:tRNA (guanine-N(1)-)-methyltransferase [Planctomycetaceae bacterium]
MVFDILTLFPEFFDSPMRQSVVGKAVANGVISVACHNLRDYTTDKHRTTDDYPYGGGHGMVMKVEPMAAAIEALKAARPGAKVVMTTPQGERFTQRTAARFAENGSLIIICGRYEGYDERIRGFADYEISMGDYVLSGGEIPALAIIDAVSRLIPGVLGEPESSEGDSFSTGLLEYPQYTRPEEFRGMAVPGVLLSGNHALIDKWRRQEALRRTFMKRPDLLELAELSAEDRAFVDGLRHGRG